MKTKGTGGDGKRTRRLVRRAAKSPTDLPGRSWPGIVKRAALKFKDDDLGHQAAALTYYSVLSIFPALLALISVLGLLGGSAAQTLLDNLGGLTPGPVQDVLTTVLRELRDGPGGSGVILVLALGVALWSASGYVAAFMRTANLVYEIGEGRPLWKRLPIRLAITVALMILFAATAIGVVLTGGLAEQVGQMLGLGRPAVTLWSIAKWPVLIVIVSLIFAVLYWAAPNVERPGFRWITGGSLLAVLGWIAASVAFGLFVGNFGNYTRVYGSLAAVVVFLIWLWLSNGAVLFGLVFNAEVERERALHAGQRAHEGAFLPPRDTRDLDTT